MEVHGTAAAGLEPVKQFFEQQMGTMAERQAQLCVYHRGDKVVDLWASPADDESFSADSLANVFSSGKSLETIAVAALVEKDLLNYDAKITEYWPEFGANGKQGLTVADLMRHEAGLANFDTSLDMLDLFVENVKQNAVGRIIEQHGLSYESPGGGRREYHALTRGWIVNELFRSVDPAGRTIGEFLREEISCPLKADALIGVRDAEMPRIAPVRQMGLGYLLLQSLVPRFLGRRIVHKLFQILRRLVSRAATAVQEPQGRPPIAVRANSGYSLLKYIMCRRSNTQLWINLCPCMASDSKRTQTKSSKLSPESNTAIGIHIPV